MLAIQVSTWLSMPFSKCVACCKSCVVDTHPAYAAGYTATDILARLRRMQVSVYSSPGIIFSP